jgi:NitT/TauT family transport system ATP-binding protein
VLNWSTNFGKWALLMGTIIFENVSKTFSGQTEIRALEDVSFAVGEGEFVALLGPSGCGKSTMLNLLAGFEKTTEGTLLFDGKGVTRPGPDRGVVFQEAALFPWLTVWQNVIFGPQVQGIARSEYEPQARKLLKLVGLEAFAQVLPAQLSGGMRQRVGIARALVMSPKALLMDEPFGALDAQTRLSMQQLLLDVWQTLGTTVLFVTHDIDEAILLSDRICVMSARPGRIIRTIPITLARPRSIASLTSGEFVAYKAAIMSDMKVTSVVDLTFAPSKP